MGYIKICLSIYLGCFQIVANTNIAVKYTISVRTYALISLGSRSKMVGSRVILLTL